MVCPTCPLGITSQPPDAPGFDRAQGFGTSLGVAVIGSATISALHGPFGQHFSAASHVGWWIVTGCGVAVLGLGLLVSGSWARETAHRTARVLLSASADDLQAASIE
jgi:hypothetical protein